MGRLDRIKEAERPKMWGRAMLSGPPGAGKSWTALSMATVLASANGGGGKILAIDTEKESLLTYADVFKFDHLPWGAPYDPDELAGELPKISGYDVVIIDSLSHFWRGTGGTLDIADGKVGGWKTARPIQERLVEAILAVNAHVILSVRSKVDYLVEQSAGKTSVTKLGLAPIQDDGLVYEVNVALEIDFQHRITVSKSRTPAVPVGRMYPPGHERKAAEEYAEWLAGGIPPAAREDVDRIVARFAEISDAQRRVAVKTQFIEAFGSPHALTASQVAAATDWLDDALSAAVPAPEPTSETSSTLVSDPTAVPTSVDDEMDHFTNAARAEFEHHQETLV